tara:strand:- start:277 stop:1071 length:795 start_codon:yes stop_codon:yes gene_type:complete
MESKEIARLSRAGIDRGLDYVTAESPLSINVTDSKNNTFEMGITMRTEGEDRRLILGFLYSEGVIDSITDVSSISIDDGIASIVLNESSSFDSNLHQRNSTVTSSCGLCGRSDINGLLKLENTLLDEEMSISLEAVSVCLKSLHSEQPIFSLTGGSHACASFRVDGSIDCVFEDVGRHNAFDKMVGYYMEMGLLPKPGFGAFVSGRASFELVQKCIRGGFPIMIAIGAPSSLAVDVSNEYGLTLGCFARDDSLTLFSGVRRVIE